MPLVTKRLVLRAARQGDLMDLHAIFSDPRAMRYWSTLPHDSPARTQENLDRLIAHADGLLTYFVIEKDGRVIGTAGMHQADEVGFILHPEYWRQGIISEAMGAIIPHLFAVTDHAQLTADADPRNSASVGILKSLGFKETHRAERTYCINGEWSDSVYFALQRPS
ncbi:ribosomal-protein-alanine N-acetyltransferase [Loktanella sp. PT4BL]|jgi:ribosomal-protein-alanine N-acetyltransferase|uniref:GNAT family N-acetyltransferase n=1 Tax=Loktanella sp. PT4BL TaxID=2135611 RepID=UPI000D769B13|nr:GNAT family N-acetyltransferase [Loktanella sp. PT4BL]PXW70637.1 ribosomal-protein-alanine N-acetyltransferase [Loktanella sp. PT4BL]